MQHKPRKLSTKNKNKPLFRRSKPKKEEPINEKADDNDIGKVKLVKPTTLRGKIKQYQPQRSIEKSAYAMIDYWNSKAGECHQIQKTQVGKQTKTLVKTLDICQDFLTGKIFNRKLFFADRNAEFEKRPYTLGEFCRGVDYFVLFQGRFFWRKHSLYSFLSGNPFERVPSIFFSHCANPKKEELKESEEVRIFINLWKEKTGQSVRASEKKYILLYVNWALPYFEEQLKGFNTLKNSFESAFDLMDFLTFAALKRINKSYFHPSILVQNWFKEKLEEVRKFHGYTI